MLGHWRLVGIGSIWDGRITLAQDVLGFIGQDTTDGRVCFTIPRYPNAHVVFEEGMKALDSLGATMTATKPQVSATTGGKEPRKMPNKVWQGCLESAKGPPPHSPPASVSWHPSRLWAPCHWLLKRQVDHPATISRSRNFGGHSDDGPPSEKAGRARGILRLYHQTLQGFLWSGHRRPPPFRWFVLALHDLLASRHCR